MTVRNVSGAGYDYHFVVDGLGRRIVVHEVQVFSNGDEQTVAYTRSTYDPQREFKELAVQQHGQRWFKLYGMDINGTGSGLHGIGGLLGVFTDSATTPQKRLALTDLFGHTVATVSVSSTGIATFESWTLGTQVSGFGAHPGIVLPVWDAVGTFGREPNILRTQLWRGYRIEPFGYYSMGARYYDPVGGRFLSPDPWGHEASMDLYSYANGDPVNFLDPTGRGAESGLPNAVSIGDPVGTQGYSLNGGWVSGDIFQVPVPNPYNATYILDYSYKIIPADGKITVLSLFSYNYTAGFGPISAPSHAEAIFKIDAWNSSINDRFNNKFSIVGTGGVKYDLKFRPVIMPVQDWQTYYNTGAVDPGRVSTITAIRSNLTNAGNWGRNDSVPHEYLHYLGAPDEYYNWYDKNGIFNEARPGNIMFDSSLDPDVSNFKSLIQSINDMNPGFNGEIITTIDENPKP